MKTSSFKYRFLEVGISICGTEFYLVFAVPYSLIMRRAKAGDTIRHLSVEDWLNLDFSAILAYHLNISPDHIYFISVKTYSFDSEFPLPIYNASSSPSSWVRPFIDLIAQTYANELIHK